MDMYDDDKTAMMIESLAEELGHCVEDQDGEIALKASVVLTASIMEMFVSEGGCSPEYMLERVYTMISRCMKRDTEEHTLN